MIRVATVLVAALMTATTIANAQEALFLTVIEEVPPIEPDPPLPPAGLVRAEKWAEVLEKAEIDAVFSIDRRRNIQLAQPLAGSLGLEVLAFSKWDMKALAAKLRADHADDRVFLSLGATNVFELMQALGFDEIFRSIREQDVMVVIPRQNDRPVIILLEVE